MKYLEINGIKRLVTPILMKPELVAMSMKGIKTQTRRDKGLEIFNQNPDNWNLVNRQLNTFFFQSKKGKNGKITTESVFCPYGKKGDILWVREMFCPLVSDWRKNPTEFVLYAADAQKQWKYKYKPNIHMSAVACRHFLEIVDVRPERLLDISKFDAISEGIEQIGPSHDGDFKNYLTKRVQKNLNGHIPGWEYQEKLPPVQSFLSLITSINGPEFYQSNPWVWRIEYKAIPKPEGFDALFPSKPKPKPLKSAV